MTDQDWKTITFHTKKKKVTKTQATRVDQTMIRHKAGSNSQQHVTSANRIEAKDEVGDYTLPKVTHNLQLQIQQARAAKNWTQKQLAQACNLPMITIRDYENGTALPRHSDIRQMSQVLGVTLRNKEGKAPL
jgi:ribosome-binding protein aMBF1 (putative translation factor)